jgi:hypothetical protein
LRGAVERATRWWKVVTVQESRRGRAGAAAIAALAGRLTERDQRVALACYEHRVLTTEQLRRLYFSAPRRARRRLALLYELRVLDRFRPARQPGQGSAQHHWILDEAGAHVVAAQLGVERAELRFRHQAALGIFGSQKLDHQLEVNEFFTRLAEDARQAGGRLLEWWGERRCLAALEGRVAPDGYGRRRAATTRHCRAARSPTRSRCSSSPSPARPGATTPPLRSRAASCRSVLPSGRRSARRSRSSAPPSTTSTPPPTTSARSIWLLCRPQMTDQHTHQRRRGETARGLALQPERGANPPQQHGRAHRDRAARDRDLQRRRRSRHRPHRLAGPSRVP